MGTSYNPEVKHVKLSRSNDFNCFEYALAGAGLGTYGRISHIQNVDTFA